jgi:hypothetical protein
LQRRVGPAGAAALSLVLVQALTLGVAGVAGVAAADDSGRPHVRAGLKAIHPGPAVSPQVDKTLTVQSSKSSGVVSPVPTVYLVFWGSQWSSDPAGAGTAVRRFFKGLFGSRDSYDAIFTQYCEGVPKGTATCGAAGIHISVPSASPLAGVWSDNTSPAPLSATTGQLASEAVRAAAHFANVTRSPNRNAQYVIASPSGTHPDGFPASGFCGWHDFTTSPYGKLAYTNLPYVPDLGFGACTTIANPGPTDGYLSTETHEYSETLTDFYPNRGWNGAKGEIGDECVTLDGRIALSTGTFDVQGEWSNAAHHCVTSG